MTVRGIDPLTGQLVIVDLDEADDAPTLEQEEPARRSTRWEELRLDLPGDGEAPEPEEGEPVLRGVALVDAVMALRRAQGEELRGLPAEQVAAMRLGDRPLSPALARWLAADADMFTIGEPQALHELLDAELGVYAEWFAELGRYLQEPCALFVGWGADSRRFLYLGATDRHGEYPVFTVDTDDTPFACLNGPVDVWLAQHAGFLESEEYYGMVPEAYEPARQALADRCFGSCIAYVEGRFSKRLDLD
jgi:hypothetical protein